MLKLVTMWNMYITWGAAKETAVSGKAAEKQNRFPFIQITESYDTPGWVGMWAPDTDILHTSLFLWYRHNLVKMEMY